MNVGWVCPIQHSNWFVLKFFKIWILGMNMSIQILLKWIDHMGLYKNLCLLVGSRYQHE